MTADPARSIGRLRERLADNEREGISDADAEVLLRFSDRLFVLGSRYSDHRHEGLLMRLVKMAAEVGGLADALHDHEAAERVVAWVHQNYDNPESNKDRRVALRMLGEHATDGPDKPESVAWIPTGYHGTYDPAPDPIDMLRLDEGIERQDRDGCRTVGRPCLGCVSSALDPDTTTRRKQLPPLVSETESSLLQAWRRYRSVPIVYRLAVSFVVGVVVAFGVGQPATALAPIGDLFLRLLQMIVIPVVVFSLLVGVRRLSPTQMGRVGGSVVGLYAVTTTIAGLIGLVVANLLHPGSGLTFTGGSAQSAQVPSVRDLVLGIVPENPLHALGTGDLLPIIFFTIVFGVALAIVRDTTDDEAVERGAETFFSLAEAGMEALFRIVWGVMEFGVIGVFALVASELAGQNVSAILALASLVGVVALGVALHITITYLGGIVGHLLGRSPLTFLRGAKNAMVTAFSTRSSSATLPVTMSDAEENFRIDESVYGFSLPLGSTANMDGAAIRQIVTVVFAANVVGQPLSLETQVSVLVVTVLISIGTAGVPGAGLIMLTVILQQAGLPLTVVGFVAAVDPILGRIATMNNVTGDLAVSALAGKWHRAIDFDGGVWAVSTSDSSLESPADD